MTLGCVWQSAILSNCLVTYSYIVIFLEMSGTLFIDGLTSQRSSLIMCQIILINSVLVVLTNRDGDQFYM